MDPQIFLFCVAYKLMHFSIRFCRYRSVGKKFLKLQNMLFALLEIQGSVKPESKIAAPRPRGQARANIVKDHSILLLLDVPGDKDEDLMKKGLWK